MDKSRRHFLEVSAAALAGITVLPTLSSCAGNNTKASATSAGKINSNFAGVAMGAITYSWRSLPGGLDNLINYCKEANVSNLELMGNDLETILGVPENPTQRLFAELRAAMEKAGQKITGRPTLSAEAQAEIEKYNKDLDAFRTNMDWDKVEEVRERFAAEGIDIHIVKTSPGANSSDDYIDYSFKLAKAMGASAVTTEMSLAAAQRVAPFAEKHDMIIALHNHFQYAQDEFKDGPEQVLAVSPKVMLNFDQGHYFGSTGKNPVDFIKKYQDRIFSMHIKDKTGPNTEGAPNANQVWGQGQTPLEEVLHYVRDNKLPIYCDIELEYDVKPWSNAVKEVGTCVKYARQILM